MFPRHAWLHACGLRLEAQAFRLDFGQMHGQTGSESVNKTDAVTAAEATGNADMGETQKFLETERQGAMMTVRTKYKAERQRIASELKDYDPVLQQILGVPPSTPIATPRGRARITDAEWKLDALPNNNRANSHVHQHHSARNRPMRKAKHHFALTLTPQSAQAVVTLQRVFRRRERAYTGMRTRENSVVMIQRWFRRIIVGSVAAEAVARGISGLKAKYKAQRRCITSEVKLYDPALQKLLGVPPSSPLIATLPGRARRPDAEWKLLQTPELTRTHRSPQPAGPDPDSNAKTFKIPKSKPSTRAATVESDRHVPSSHGLYRVTAVLSRFNVSVSSLKTPTAKVPTADKPEYWFSCQSSVPAEHTTSDCESGVTVTADIVISNRGNQNPSPDDQERANAAESSPSLSAETPPVTGLLVGVRLPPRLHVRLTEIDFASLTRIIDQNFLHPACQPSTPVLGHALRPHVRLDSAEVDPDDPAKGTDSVPQRARAGEPSPTSARGALDAENADAEFESELETMSMNESLKSFLLDEMAIEVHTRTSPLPFVFHMPAS